MPVDIWVPRKFVEHILQEHAQHDQKDHGNWANGKSSHHQQIRGYGRNGEISHPTEIVEHLGLSEWTIQDDQAMRKFEEDWLLASDPDAKQGIYEFGKGNQDLRNLRAFMAYQETTGNKSFEKWMDTPLEIFRSGYPTYGETFANFTISKSVAQQFAHSHGKLYKLTIKPKDVFLFSSGAAGEVYITEFTGKLETITEALATLELGSVDLSQILEHLPGEHDQKTHGRRNGQQDNDYLWRSGNVTILKGKKGRLGNRGISKARKGILEDGTEIIYKQQVIERIEDGYTGKEEEAYYVVANEYFNEEGVVPKTVYRDDGYIAQEFVGDATSVASHGTFKMGEKPKGGEVPRDPQPLRNIVVMDMVMGNTDRHPGNVLLDNKTGKAYAIDNDASFYPGKVIIEGGEVKYIMDRSVMTLSKINNNERKWLDFSIKKVNPAYFSGLSSKDVTPRRQDILKGIEVINNPKFKSYIMTTLGEGAWEQTELRKIQMQEMADES